MSGVMDTETLPCMPTEGYGRGGRPHKAQRRITPLEIVLVG
jgi:hypothetical protein